MSSILAIFAAPSADTADATEFLRVTVALLAVGRNVRLVEAGRGVGVLSALDPKLTAEGERYLDGLGANGVLPLATPELGGALADTEGIVRLGDPSRSGIPALLVAREGPDGIPGGWSSLLAAGQVLWASDLPAG